MGSPDRGLSRPLGFHPGALSGIVLAGANRGATHIDESDGILTALEVAELDLSAAHLVVMSACETGLGRAAGGEGLLSLQRAMQIAGARSVVASLWEVEDQASARLMTRFYERWNPQGGEGISAAAALKAAQAHVRSRAEWEHPYYWAAWVLWGLPD